MTIDDRAIEAFMNSHSKDWHQYKSVSFAFKIDDIVRCLEAYEAAKWRPIEEAPKDGSKILIWWPAGVGNFGPYHERTEILRWCEPNDDDAKFPSYWKSEIPGRSLTHGGLVDVGAMFKTIEPGPQK